MPSGVYNKTKENNPNWKGGLPVCLDCGKILSSRKSKKCNSCSKKGRKHLEVIKRKIRLANTGKKRTKEMIKKMIEMRINEVKNGSHRYWLGKKRPLFSKAWKRKISEANIGEKCNFWKGGKYKTKMGYVYVQKPEHPFATKLGYIRKHRLIAEKCLNRYLTKLEVIHHINEITDDNRPENLYLFATNKEHIMYHGYKNKLILISNLI